MDKNIVILQREAQGRIVDAVNRSLGELPAFAVLQIVEGIAARVREIDTMQYSDALAAQKGKEEE